MYHTISVSGDAEGWNIAFYVFTGCRSLLCFVVIILLATGERTLHEHLLAVLDLANIAAACVLLAV